MSALTAPRNNVTKGLDKVLFTNLDVMLKANAVVFQGALIMMQGGYGKPGAAGVGWIAAGFADLSPAFPSVTAGASDGAVHSGGSQFIRVKQGVGTFNNSSAGDAIAQANVNQLCYVVDDQTVALTDGAGTRSIAGVIMEVSSSGVLVCVCAQLTALVGAAGAAEQNPEELAANGAVSPTNPVSRFTVSGTKAYTLADGTKGKRKRLYCVSAAASPLGTVTPAHASGFTSITLTTAQSFVDLVFDDSLGTPAWKLAGVAGTVTVT